MRQHEPQLRDLDVQTCVVTFDADPLAMAYVREAQLEWPLLIDRDRTLYQAYGMLRASRWQIYGPASIWVYVKLLASGRRLQMPGSDIYQRGGDVLIDPQGIVRLHHVGSGPADRPAVAKLLAVIRDSGAGS